VSVLFEKRVEKIKKTSQKPDKERLPESIILLRREKNEKTTETLGGTVFCIVHNYQFAVWHSMGRGERGFCGNSGCFNGGCCG
jgi:hypothetical protein